MSVSQITTVGIIGASFFVATQMAYHALFPTPFIEIHEASYANGIVTMDRTVNADGPVFNMTKTADLINDATGQRVCHGERDNNLTSGHRIGQAPLAVWLGDDACDPQKLPAGEYRAVAVYAWAGKQYPVEIAGIWLPDGVSGR